MNIQWHKVTWYSWTLAGIVFLVVIPTLIFYFIGQYKEIKNIQPEVVVATSTTSTIPSDWKTYTDSHYNFSFKYPSSGIVGCEDNGDQACVLNTGAQDISFEVKPEPFPEDWYEHQEIGASNISDIDDFNLITAGNKQGYSFKEGDVGMVRWTVVLPINSSHTLYIYFSGCETNPQDVDKLNSDTFGYGICTGNLAMQSYGRFHEDTDFVNKVLASFTFK